MSLRIMSFFILLLISNLGFAINHSYYCGCHPPSNGSCTCHRGDATNPVTGASEVGIAWLGQTGMFVHCTNSNATIDGPDYGESGPYVWRSSKHVHCAIWASTPATANPKTSFCSCTNTTFYDHKININYITCYAKV